MSTKMMMMLVYVAGFVMTLSGTLLLAWIFWRLVGVYESRMYRTWKKNVLDKENRR